jgi:hypothetical protein
VRDFPAVPFTLAPNTGQIFFLRIDATATGARLGQLQFNSNDPANPVLRIGLSAVASLLATGTVVLRLDDGTFERQAGFPGGDGFFLSRLKPSAYPATLKAIRIYFGERSLEPGEGFGLLWAAHRSSGVCRVRGDADDDRVRRFSGGIPVVGAGRGGARYLDEFDAYAILCELRRRVVAAIGVVAGISVGCFCRAGGSGSRGASLIAFPSASPDRFATAAFVEPPRSALLPRTE